MSTGKWKPQDNPPDYQPTNPLHRLAELEEEIAAHHSGLAEAHGLKSQLYRTLGGPRRNSDAAPSTKPKAA